MSKGYTACSVHGLRGTEYIDTNISFPSVNAEGKRCSGWLEIYVRRPDGSVVADFTIYSDCTVQFQTLLTQLREAIGFAEQAQATAEGVEGALEEEATR